MNPLIIMSKLAISLVELGTTYGSMHQLQGYKINVIFLPGGPGAKTLCFQCRGPRCNSWSGNQIPQVGTKSFHATAKDPTCHKEDQRPSEAKYINIYFLIKNNTKLMEDISYVRWKE